MNTMPTRTGEPAHWGLIGHEWAIEGLARCLAEDRVAHAYLFTGPHAIGKTTLARALAQALECTGAVRPCGECTGCRKVARDRHPDVQVIEGVPVGYKIDESSPPPPPRKNEREPRLLKIDQIRALQHDLSRSPFEGRWKIAILRRFDEANDEAANAFLKTLEEPPPHTRLMLTARDASLLLPTITSRCQVLSLRPLTLSQVETALIERWQVEPSQARLLARLSGGRLGWAVRASQAESQVLAARRHHLEMLQTALAQGRAERITLAGDLAKDKENLPELLQSWTGWWRDILLIQNGQESRATNLDYADVLRDQAGRFTLSQVEEILKSLRATARYVEQNVNARLAAEVLLLNFPGTQVN